MLLKRKPLDMDSSADSSNRLISLRSRLLRHILPPLLITWALGTALVIGVANHFVTRAFDRSILDDAYAIASHVQLQNGKLHLQLSQAELGSLLFDQSDQIYFSVRSLEGQLIAGNAGLPASLPSAGAAYAFSDGVQQGRTIRSVTLLRKEPAPYLVVAAQTASSRTQMLQQLALYSLLPQLLLLAALAFWLMRAISRDMRPLNELERELERRDVRDLSPLSIQATTRDVQHLRDALNALLMRVAQGVKAQREFAGNVAHELRTPLAGIRALSAYALTRQEPELWRKQLEDIACSEARASHMIDQLLALALAEETGAATPMTEIRLDLLVREAILRTLPRADALGADLGAEGIDVPCTVRGNAALVEGILNNLLDNALRYAHPSQGAKPIITVVLKSSALDASTTLCVNDNGMGISPTQIEQLQGRWQQGSMGIKLQHGSGLGLAIVTEYARLMGAQLRFQTFASEQPVNTGLNAQGMQGLSVQLQFIDQQVPNHIFSIQKLREKL